MCLDADVPLEIDRSRLHFGLGYPEIFSVLSDLAQFRKDLIENPAMGIEKSG